MGSALETLGFIANVLLFPIYELFDVLNIIFELLMDGWDAFVDSTSFDEIVNWARAVWSEVSKPIGEISELIGKIGEEWAKIWEDDDGVVGAKSAVEVISDIIGAIAWVVAYGIIPGLRLIGYLVEGIVMIVKPFLEAIKWMLEVTNGSNKSNNYVDTPSTYDNDLANKYVNTNNLTTNSSNLYKNDNSTVIVNNYEKGAIPVDARNMTKDEASNMVVTALGYDKVYNTGGITR